MKFQIEIRFFIELHLHGNSKLLMTSCPPSPKPWQSQRAVSESRIAEFSAVTGIDSDRAKLFLESSNWQLQVISLKSNLVT